MSRTRLRDPLRVGEDAATDPDEVRLTGLEGALGEVGVTNATRRDDGDVDALLDRFGQW